MKKMLVVLVLLSLVSTVCVQAQTPAGSTMSVHFPPNSANLRAVSTELAIANLQTFTQVARQLADNPQARVLIDGHANAILGTVAEERNTLRPLSQRRAEAAANFLVENFRIDRHRLIIAGAGGGYPTSSTDGSQNRRVSFTIIR
ncbi:MAG: OmpA family protein [Treponema sp.]|nr:OmpA family protein [Treponema sp.]